MKAVAAGVGWRGECTQLRAAAWRARGGAVPPAALASTPRTGLTLRRHRGACWTCSVGGRRSSAACGVRAMMAASSTSAPSLKRRLVQNGEQLYGAFLMSASPVIADLMACVGYDYLVVDMEHGPGGYMETLAMIQAVRSRGCPVVVRVPSNNSVDIKKVLDMGPDGLIIPMVDSAEEAAEAVSASTYPPVGQRGTAYPLVRASEWGTNQSYASTCVAETLLLMQVETPESVAAVTQIAAVPGVDGVFIGPFDLSATMGHLGDPGNTDVLKAIEQVERDALASGTLLGGFIGTGKTPKRMFQIGYSIVGGAADIGLLRDAAIANVKATRYSSWK